MVAVLLRVHRLGRTRSSPLRFGYSVQPDGVGDREDRQARAAASEAQDRRSPPDHVRQYQTAAQNQLAGLEIFHFIRIFDLGSARSVDTAPGSRLLSPFDLEAISIALSKILIA